MTVGERIQAARKKAGMKQSELAEKLGVAVITIGQYERGKRQPNLEQLRRIAAALDSDVVYLVCGQTTTELQSGILIQAEAEAKVEFEKLQLESQSRSFDERVSISSALIRLFKLFGRFNPIGYQKAVERVEELAEIPKYQRPAAPQSTPAEDTAPPPNAPQHPQEDEE